MEMWRNVAMTIVLIVVLHEVFEAAESWGLAAGVEFQVPVKAQLIQLTQRQRIAMGQRSP